MLLRNKTDWSLLARYLAGEGGEKEKIAVEKWLKKSAGNRELFENIRSDWKIMEKMKKFDVDKAWNNVHSRIKAAENETDAVVLPRRSFVPGGMIKIAASLLILAMLSVAVYVITLKTGNVTVVTALNDHRTITLPDGTRITLNGETRVNYPKRFTGDTRNVELKGEAFFEVAPDKKHPFIIHSGNADVRVVGTSFNVETGNATGQVQVFVSTGIVKLYEHGNESNSVILHPGDMGTLSDKQIAMHKAGNENAIAWKTGRMDFRDISMSEAVNMMNKVYGANIICSEPVLASRHLTGEYRYPDEPLDTILHILAQQNPGLKIEKSGNKIYLSK